MNEYDTGRIREALATATPIEDVQRPDDASIIVLNTCSIREKAQEKVFDELGRLRPLKKSNPDLIIAVGGCVASQEGQHIIDRAPYVDVVFGPQTLHRLPDLIKAKRETRKPQVDITFPEIEKFDALPPAKVEGTHAFLSIMEGCSKYCSFCIVPYTRGEEISRPLSDVLKEVDYLIDQGVIEITLLGQNVNAYAGIVNTEDDDTVDLAYLIEAIANKNEIKRIRYTTSHPKEMSKRLCDVYAHVPKLVSHLHLPIQSGSDRVLAAMKRGYTALEYKSIIRRLRSVRPDISISSDFIVGFPGETEEDFQKTMSLIREVYFDASFSFLYSPRPGTPANSLTDTVPHQTKQQRLYALQALLNEQAMALSEKMLGSIQRVRIEGPSKKDPQQWAGRTENNRIVNFSIETTESIAGQMHEVAITEALPNSLRGHWIQKIS